MQRGTKLYVIHCAAMVSVSTLVADRIWDVNVNGTQNIIDLCLAHNARLAFIGSTGAIPEQPMGVAIREVESYDPEAVTGLYDQTKAAASQLVLDAVAERLRLRGRLGREIYGGAQDAEKAGRLHRLRYVQRQLAAGVLDSAGALCQARAKGQVRGYEPQSHG